MMPLFFLLKKVIAEFIFRKDNVINIMNNSNLNEKSKLVSKPMVKPHKQNNQ